VRHDPLECYFCGRTPSEGKEVLAGRDAYVCSDCVALAEAVLGSGESAGNDRLTLRLAEGKHGERCPFCSRSRPGAALVVVAGGNGICEACVAVARDALDAEWRPLPGGGMVK
jgi:ClpX C4-type zinc finger